ncbi:hypothetical protein [Sulfurimonas sp.]|uniref:DUF4376 domain-containing protein n=1 Tax=Sulfurimonas sp. TaxID=2022749 RepID=UPI002B46D2A6|nr:hypothetical protein [Sulfurimonas sp.]
MIKKLHFIALETKEYLYSKEINTAQCGLDLPNSTELEPLPPKKGFAVCFVKKKWVYVVDNRTKIYYLNKEKVVFKLGDKITNEMSLKRLSYEEILKQKREEKIVEIKLKCTTSIESGFESTALGNVHLYKSDRDDQLNLTGMKDRGISLPLKCSADHRASWEWKPHTPLQLQKVFNAGVDFKLAQLQKCALLKSAILYAKKVEDLVEINWEKSDANKR